MVSTRGHERVDEMISAPPSLAVLVSGNGSNLQSIIDQIENGSLEARIACVISNNPRAYGLLRARRHGINVHCIDHRDFAARSGFERCLLDYLEPHRPDLVILAGFMRILSEDFIARFPGRILNIHPSLLPRFKGLDTHKRVLEAGDDCHGATVHVVTAELDSGTIVLQRAFDVEPGDNLESLQQKTHAVEHVIYPLAITQYIHSGYNPAAFSGSTDRSNTIPE